MYIYFIYIACEDSWSTHLHSVLRTLPAGYYIYIYIYVFLYVLLVKTAGFIVMMSLNVRNTLWRYALVLCKDLLIECVLDQFEVG